MFATHGKQNNTAETNFTVTTLSPNMLVTPKKNLQSDTATCKLCLRIHNDILTFLGFEKNKQKNMTKTRKTKVTVTKLIPTLLAHVKRKTV